MSREIPDSNGGGDFHPMVSLRDIKSYVKGTVIEIGSTQKGNPAVTLALIDTNASVQKSVSKGVYEEVSVGEGDLVQLIGSYRQLRDKLPQLKVNDVVTVTHTEDKKVPKGTMKVFSVIVED